MNDLLVKGILASEEQTVLVTSSYKALPSMDRAIHVNPQLIFLSSAHICKARSLGGQLALLYEHAT